MKPVSRLAADTAELLSGKAYELKFKNYIFLETL